MTQKDTVPDTLSSYYRDEPPIGDDNAPLDPEGSPEPQAPEKPGKLERINRRIAQLQRQKKAIEARLKQEERKKRTRRLIQIGAIAAKYLECPNASPPEFERILRRRLGLGGK